MDLAELGALADRLEDAKNRRLQADKIAADLKSEETRLKQALIAEMEANDLSSVGGKTCVVNRIKKERAQVADWNALYEFIGEHGAFDLLEKRLRTPPCLLRRDDDVEIPGVYYQEYSHITYAKART